MINFSHFLIIPQVPRQLIRDMVILAPPSHLPISVVILKSLLQTRFKVKALAHVHSDVKSIDRKLKRIFKDEPRYVMELYPQFPFPFRLEGIIESRC